jgi:hypothetical protein
MSPEIGDRQVRRGSEVEISRWTRTSRCPCRFLERLWRYRVLSLYSIRTVNQNICIRIGSSSTRASHLISSHNPVWTHGASPSAYLQPMSDGIVPIMLSLPATSDDLKNRRRGQLAGLGLAAFGQAHCSSWHHDGMVMFGMKRTRTMDFGKMTKMKII